MSAINLVNFILSDFRLNYSEGNIVLIVSADYASLTSYSVGENLTQYSFVLRSVVLHYSDEARSLDLELSSLTLNVEVNYTKLVVAVEGIANLPLWVALANRLFGTG